MSSDSQHIHYENDDGIATITIDRPEKKNAMTYAMLGEFINTVKMLRRRRAPIGKPARSAVVNRMRRTLWRTRHGQSNSRCQRR